MMADNSKVWISSMLVGLMKVGNSGTEAHNISGGKAPAAGASTPGVVL